MPDNTKIIHLGPAEGDAFPAVGDVYRVLASGRQTGDVYSISKIRVSRNNGPPSHIHSREDESFFVLEGEIEFQVGDEQITARPGTFIQGPRGINFFKEFAQPVASFDSPAIPASKDEVDKLLAAAPKYGLQILPPNT